MQGQDDHSVQPNITMPRPKAVQVYTALLTQEGEGAPGPNTVLNTTNTPFVWERIAAGQYRVTGPIMAYDSTIITLEPSASGWITYTIARPSLTTVELYTAVAGAAPSDDHLVNTGIRIEIYNPNVYTY